MLDRINSVLNAASSTNGTPEEVLQDAIKLVDAELAKVDQVEVKKTQRKIKGANMDLQQAPHSMDLQYLTSSLLHLHAHTLWLWARRRTGRPTGGPCGPDAS